MSVLLVMSGVRGGFLTNHLADLSFPPWFYIVLRGLVPGKRVIRSVEWFGQSPERAALSIFLVGLVSEISQHYRPRGLFAGTYDLWDIAAYAGGLLVCYGVDWYIAVRRRGTRHPATQRTHQDIKFIESRPSTSFRLSRV